MNLYLILFNRLKRPENHDEVPKHTSVRNITELMVFNFKNGKIVGRIDLTRNVSKN